MTTSKRLVVLLGRRALLAAAATVVGVVPLIGCASMSQAQKEAVELRRFCERNPQASTTCLGFHGQA
jgi:hypothetical protein